MLRRKLGSTNLEVSEISLGSWLTYSGGIARERSIACIQAAFDAGIHFIDTANVYGDGASESLLGEVLTGRPRDSYVLATKLFFPMPLKVLGLPTGRKEGGLSARQIEKQLDASLKRLRTDHVDLYYCHRYDPDTPVDETVAGLTRAVEAGKTRYIGFSNWNAEQMDNAASLSASKGYASFVASQPQYSLLWRTAESATFPATARHGIGNVVYSPLAQGVLSGKYKPGAPPPSDSRAANDEMNMFMQTAGRRFRSDDLLAAVQALVPIAADLGLTLSQLALAWVLRREEVASAIIGASRPEQILENAKASGVKLSGETLARIDAVIGSVVVY